MKSPAHTGARTPPPPPSPDKVRKLIPQDHTIETPQHGRQYGETGTVVHGKVCSVGGQRGSKAEHDPSLPHRDFMQVCTKQQVLE